LERLKVRTGEREELKDITGEIERIIEKKGWKEGAAHIYVPHTTAGILVNEGADPDVAGDILRRLKVLAPLRGDYRHYEGNSDAHIKASLTGSSLLLMVEGGRLRLGRWQRVFFAEFDGPRQREVWISFLPRESVR